MRAQKEGYYAGVLFIIQMKGVQVFRPNDRTHPQFGETLRKAEKQGVHILAFDCEVTERSMRVDARVPVEL